MENKQKKLSPQSKKLIQILVTFLFFCIAYMAFVFLNPPKSQEFDSPDSTEAQTSTETETQTYQ